MIPEIGHLALTIALALALLQGILPIAGVIAGRPTLMAVAQPAARIQCAFVSLAFAILAYAFVTNDFSVAYVAQNSNSLLPVPYRFSAVWGAHEGSLLLWVFVLALWTAAVSVFDRSLPRDFAAVVVAVMGLVSVGFLLFLLLTSNPFVRALPTPVDGADLNPLLQDPGLVIHPPVLYAGYVGTSVAFGFAIAALITGRLTAQVARWVRPWAVGAWILLTLGIALGSWWAYYELGWGGWWFWDPVENASFMPWLLGTALIHSLAVTEKRGTFKSWTVLLAILCFALSLLGTFLVRSGVLTSVHAFATDPTRGVFILALLSVAIGGSLALYAWRGPATLRGGSFAPVSRETFLLVNSLLLAASTATVLLGTLYPLAHEAVGLGKISVGPPYFNLAFVVLTVPLILALGIGQVARWKSDSFGRLLADARYAIVAAVAAGLLAAYWWSGPRWFGTAGGIALGVWVIASTVNGVVARARGRARPWRTLATLPPAVVGQCLAHVGFGVTVLGVTLTSLQASDEHVRMAPGDQVELAGYRFQFDSLEPLRGPNYDGVQGRFTVYQDDRMVATLLPEKRRYQVRGASMTEAGIDPGLLRDLYVSLGEPLEGNAWSVRVHHKPLVRWIWLGAILMALGGAAAISDRRFRVRATRQVAVPGQAAARAAR